MKKLILMLNAFFYKSYADIWFFNHFWNWNQSFNYTVLIYAASKGHIEIVDKLLSQQNIDINYKSILIQEHLYYSNIIF